MSSFEIQIKKAISRYTKEVESKINDAIDDIAAESLKRIKETSPKRTRKYSKSWRAEVKRESGSASFRIYNAKHWQLTHLLENGHLTRNKNRYVSAKPHIAPVQEWAEGEINRRIEEALKE